MTLENIKAPFFYNIKLCASFQSHGWIQTGVTVWKFSIRVKIGNFLSLVTLKFDGWPWKTTGYIFYTKSSFVHHFKAMGEFKLELQSGNAQFGSKSAIFGPVWPWNLKMTLKNDRATLPCYFKLSVSFRSHWWNQTGFIVRKRPMADFLSHIWPWNLMNNLEKTIRHLFYATLSFVHHSIAISEFKLELQSGNTQFGSKSTIFLAVWPWNLTDDLEKGKGTSPHLLQALCIIL